MAWSSVSRSPPRLIAPALLGCDALTRIDELERRSDAFREALYGSTLPVPVLDAAGSQMSIIRTTTCLRTEGGRFHAFEGCNDNSGCCPMDCTHVWNYEQALAFLARRENDVVAGMFAAARDDDLRRLVIEAIFSPVFVGNRLA